MGVMKKTLAVDAACLLSLALLAWPGALRAACDKNDVTTAGMMGCASEELERADKALNEAYARLMKKLPDEIARAKLKKSERAWMAFRDANAAFMADDNRDGSAEGLEDLGVRTTMTKARAAELREALKSYDDR
jgi:uncharacterized protein YecT (DUF1311 family)